MRAARWVVAAVGLLLPALAQAGSVASATMDGEASALAAILVERAIQPCDVPEDREVRFRPGKKVKTGDACLDRALSEVALEPAPKRITAQLVAGPAVVVGAPGNAVDIPYGTSATGALDLLDAALAEQPAANQAVLVSSALKWLARPCDPDPDATSLIADRTCPPPCPNFRIRTAMGLTHKSDRELDELVGVECAADWLPADVAMAVGWRVVVRTTMQLRAAERTLDEQGPDDLDARKAHLRSLVVDALRQTAPTLRADSGRWERTEGVIAALAHPHSLIEDMPANRARLSMALLLEGTPVLGTNCHSLIKAVVTGPPEFAAVVVRTPGIPVECPNPCQQEPWPRLTGDQLRTWVIGHCDAEAPDPVFSAAEREGMAVEWISLIRAATSQVQLWAEREDTPRARRAWQAITELAPYLLADPGLSKAQQADPSQLDMTPR